LLLRAAGKSSLIGALFRLTEIESGLITIDGVNTKAVALRQLRSSMALIPQVWLSNKLSQQM
jgi:ABC-type multidrug transport system fused ATPase/permease subunit